MTENIKNQYIEIKGARVHNLKNIDLQIPRNKMVVITGLSGSGKSSLAFDTLYAEGQRRYVESLSSYARQFLGRMDKPDVDYIKGIPPAIAIEQKVNTRNPRSTVGTSTEIYDYIKLLYARIGRTYSPATGKEVIRHEVSDVVNAITAYPYATKVILLAPFQITKGRTLGQEADLLQQQGFTRLEIQGNVVRIADIDEELANKKKVTEVNIVIDRFSVSDDEDLLSRIADSVQTSFYEGKGECLVRITTQENKTTLQSFSNRFEADGIVFEEPSLHTFSFNNPIGACPVCEGYGKTIGIDEDLVIPNKSLSVYNEAIVCWKGEKMGEWKEQLIMNSDRFNFPIHTPYYDLSAAQKRLLWTGNQYFEGIDAFFKQLESQTYKIQNRVALARYRGKTTCNTCDGGRLRQEALCVKIGNTNISELTGIPMDEVLAFFKGLDTLLSDHDRQIAKRLLIEINNRLHFMVELGLGYLTLDRISSTLSGGETQRIHLTRTLGSNLTASMYLLDEPSVGLHPRDTGRLVKVLKDLRDLGNTVVVVEHEETVIENADYLVDMGPEAGIHGGHVVYSGPYSEIAKAAPESLTTKYMTGELSIQTPTTRRPAKDFLTLNGARQHNLKNIDVRIPFHCLTVVSGVSGSGKTTLVRDILFPALSMHLPENAGKQPGLFDGLDGNVKKVTRVEFINQSPIGKSSRSNPVTYVKAYDYVRELFAKQQLSKIRGFQPKHFSFNVEGGRCETCKGEGEQVVEMQFLADVHLECEECKGRRFRQEVLEVQYKGKSIFDVLNLSVEEALEFFKGQKDITDRIQPLFDVGLGYVHLGQSSSTLSGGEAQRVKLGSFLIRENSGGHIFFIFDEPTTGLHFHDIQKLLTAINALVEKGHSVLVVEHNMEVIKSADWVIDLGPEGGKEGGNLVFEGVPEDLAKVAGSYTGAYLKDKLGK